MTLEQLQNIIPDFRPSKVIHKDVIIHDTVCVREIHLDQMDHLCLLDCTAYYPEEHPMSA